MLRRVMQSVAFAVLIAAAFAVATGVAQATVMWGA